jgi:septum formation protein
MKLAEAKAIDVSLRHAEAVVIGADQVLALGSKIYGKPRDRAHCQQQLRELRGKTHVLISAVVVARDGKTLWSQADEALLTMRDFSDAFLASYLDAIGDDCTSSVGGYKIEGRGVQLDPARCFSVLVRGGARLLGARADLDLYTGSAQSGKAKACDQRVGVLY